MKAFTTVSFIFGMVGALASNLRSGTTTGQLRSITAVLSTPFVSTNGLSFVDSVKDIASMDVAAVAIGMYDSSSTSTSSDPITLWNNLGYMDRVNAVSTFKARSKSIYMGAKLTLDNQAIANGLKGADVAATYCYQVPQGLFDGLMLQVDTSDVGYRMAVDDFFDDFITTCKQIIGDKPLMLAMTVEDVTDNNIPLLSNIGQLSGSIASMDILQFGSLQKDLMISYDSIFVSAANYGSWSQVAKNMRLNVIRIAKSQNSALPGSLPAATLAMYLKKAGESIGYQSGITSYDHNWLKSHTELAQYYSTLAH